MTVPSTIASTPRFNHADGACGGPEHRAARPGLPVPPRIASAPRFNQAAGSWGGPSLAWGDAPVAAARGVPEHRVMTTTIAAPPRRHENPVLGDAATIVESAAAT